MEITNPQIEQYCREHTTPLHTIFEDLKKITHEKMGTAARMQVGSLEGSFLKFLVSIQGAQRVLEIGTFTGYSALAMASGLPANGQLITCDVDPNATKIAQEYWNQSEHGKKIQLHLGPALQTIEKLDHGFDLVFIDADKANYINYWEACLPKLKTGGVIAVDNVLWSGRVLNPQEKSDLSIVAFNQHAIKDSRVTTIMLPLRDGLLLARKN